MFIIRPKYDEHSYIDFVYLNIGQTIICVKSLGEPYTNEKNGTSVTFTKTYAKYRLMVKASCIHKSLRLKISLKTK